MADKEEFLVLTDEEGIEHEFSVLDVIEVDDKRYAVLLSLDEEEAEEEHA